MINPPDSGSVFMQIGLDPAAGFFDSLVKAFSPEWNGYLK